MSLAAESDFLRRYARHVVLPQIGEEGQRALSQKSVLIIGAGGLGSTLAGFLAAAGVGRLGLVDADRVEVSNLNRQVVFETADIGQFKVDAVKTRIEEIEPACKVSALRERVRQDNAQTLIGAYDLVADGSDNFDTRLVVNRAAFAAKRPLVSAAISGTEAQISTFKAHQGEAHPCYQCLVASLPERAMDCAQEGILGPLAGMMASFQALEVIKELLGIGESLSGRLLRFDALSARWKESKLVRDPACPVCKS